MSLQTPEVAAAKIQEWLRAHPSIAQTDQNIAVLVKYMKDFYSVSGESVIDSVFLDLAYKNIGAQLQHLAGPEVQQQIDQANQQAAAAQQQLDSERAEKVRQDEIKRRELERDARQAALPGPGRASAYGSASDAAALANEQAAKRKAALAAAQNRARHESFLAELRDINMYLATTPGGLVSYSKTQDYKTAAKENLKRKYPMFAHLVS